MAQVKNGWLSVKPEEIEHVLGLEHAVNFDAMKQAYAAYKATPEYTAYVAAKKELEDGIRAEHEAKLGRGKALVFGYSFGKLSIKVGEARAERPAAKPAINLGDFLAGQEADGFGA